MKHNIFIAQNISKLRPKLESEKCMVMPVGCAIDTEEHPRWDEITVSGVDPEERSGVDSFGLGFIPNGGLVVTTIFSGGDEMWSYTLLGRECIIWVDGQYTGSGRWNTKNVQTLYTFSDWFDEYIGSGSGGGGAPKGKENNALAIRPCRDYTSIDVPDGTKFYNAYIDGSGNVYDAVKIGNQLWTTENLKTTKLQNGVDIQLGENTNDFKYNDNTPLYTYYNYNSVGDYYKDIYGGLYNWYCIKNNIINYDGWRVPTMLDLGRLKTNLINTKWCGDVDVNSSNVSRFIKSCRQVNHPLDV